MSRLAARAYVLCIALSLVAGGSWAAVGLNRHAATVGDVRAAPSSTARAAAASVRASSTDRTQAPDLTGLTTPLAAGEFLVGTAQVSLAPDPSKIQWDTPKTPCVKEDQSLVDPGASDLAGAAQAGHLPPGWPKSPNCVYLGGYGLGPARPAAGVDPYAGVYVRSIAISNGRDVVLWQSFDMVGFFSRYRSDLCPQGCGMYDIREAIANATFDKVPTANIAINATHTHGGADGYGAWGGLPDWYRAQIREQALQSAFAALRNLTPATIAVGEVDARPFNNERRDTYYSAADYGAVWLQAKTESGASSRVIATLVNFAAHPTVLGDDNQLMHSDWIGTAGKELGDAFGGEGVVIQGALGNVSPSMPRGATKDYTGDHKTDNYDNAIQMAKDFTAFIGADIARGGHVLTSNRIATKTTTIAHPASNWVEEVGALANLLDREFSFPSVGANGPSTYTWRKSPDAPPAGTCTTAGPISVKVDVSGFRIGDLTVITGPGELFGTIAEVVKSKAAHRDPDGETMVFAQTQDSLGYIIQDFEVDVTGGVTNNTDPPLGEYEEEFMVDRCFGDHVLQTQLDVLNQLQ